MYPLDVTEAGFLQTSKADAVSSAQPRESSKWR